MQFKIRRLCFRTIMLPQLLAVGIFFAPDSANADELCGRQFDSLSQLYDDVRHEANRGWRIIERSTHVILAGDQTMPGQKRRL
jgi:hypothetical protein